MQLSIIILNYNVRYFLEQCIKSVQQAITNIDAEIIVVDNNSNDGSDVLMQTKFPEILYLKNKENLGFSKGNNIGVANAKGKYICILNPDTVVAEDTFIKIIQFYESQDNVGIVGCKLIDGRGNFLPESKRGIPTYWRSFVKISGLYRLFPQQKKLNGYYAAHLNENTSGCVEVLVGAFMFLSKAHYKVLGGFDEQFFMYVEDTDFCYRSLKAGYKNYYCADTSIIHYKGESTVKDSEYVKRFHHATKLFYEKHFKQSFLFDILMQTISLLFLLFKKKQIGQKILNVQQRYWISNVGLEKVNSLNFINQKIIKLDNLVELSNILSNTLNANDGVSEVIFDGNFLTNKDIIDFMAKNANNQMIYKIKPPNSRFLIGSNDSNGRGEVLILED